MRKTILYSQNFLRNRNLVTELINKSSITNNDIVYEVGAGHGIITQELIKISKKVVAFEIDRYFSIKLAQRFQNEKSLVLKSGNFLSHSLPSHPYKVFSNIPFNVTSDVIKKLTQAQNPPDDAYIIVQKDAAKKFVGMPLSINNSQISVLLKPWFDFSTVHEFNRKDFLPIPKVDAILLRIKKRHTPWINPMHKKTYEDFIVYSFNQFSPNIVEGLAKVIGKHSMLNLAKNKFSTKSKPSQLGIEHWLSLFNYFIKNVDISCQNIIKNSYRNLLDQQTKLQKIHRSRTKKNWRKYK